MFGKSNYFSYISKVIRLRSHLLEETKLKLKNDKKNEKIRIKKRN